MEQLSQVFLDFISTWGYVAVAVLMAMENACIPIPSELVLGFAGYLVFAGQMNFSGAVVAGIIGGMLGSVFAYYVGYYGGRPFVNKYGKYFLMSPSHVDTAQRWFDKYGIKAVFFSRILPVVRTFISLPAGFAKVSFKQFIFYTFLGSLPWTILILYCGVVLGENWQVMREVGHEASLVFVFAATVVLMVWYIRYKKKRQNEKIDR